MTPTTTRRYRLPGTFAEYQRAVDCPIGTVVRETKRHVFVDADITAFVDLHSAATMWSGYLGTPDGADNLGLCTSAKWALKALDADPFPADEIAAENHRAAIEWEAGREQREAEHAAWKAQAAEARAAREREEREHPVVPSEYTATPTGFAKARPGGGIYDLTVGVDQQHRPNLIVGARLRVIIGNAWTTLDVTAVGDEYRGGYIPVTATRIADTLAVRIELC